MRHFESIKPAKDVEVIAEEELDALLSDPDNAFLEQHQKNIDRIEGAESAVDALAIAKELVTQRLERTLQVSLLSGAEGVEMNEVNMRGVLATIESIKANQEQIGDGGDAFVVIDTTEIAELPPEICYKFAKEEVLKRGRNTVTQEAEVHEEFYAASEQLSDNRFAVPMPFFCDADR